MVNHLPRLLAVTLDLQFYSCRVCVPFLFSPQKLEEADLPSESYQPDQRDLADFDPNEYAEAPDWCPDGP